jgi:uncharacterized protein YkwD
MRSFAMFVVSVITACGAGPRLRPASALSGPRAEDPVPAMGSAARRSASPPARRLTISEARLYMVELINRDRKSQGLAPVELDPGPPTFAGQAHAEDMARHGFLGHYGSDGSVPEQRLTEAGGADMVLENAACMIDEHARTLDPAPLIDPAEIERTESMFFDEVPPNDGHRRNILRPAHKRVGVGIAQPVSTSTEIAVPCFSQEFVDPYGAYTPLPATARVGQTVHVSGALSAPAAPAGVGIARIDLPKALGVSELNRRRAYAIPKPYQLYWPKGFVTPVPLTVDGRRFSIAVPLQDHGAPGLYEVSVWARFPDSTDPVMVSLRTVRVGH